MKHYSEKRDFIRMRVETPITFMLNGNSYDAVCIDLSSSGMQVEVESTAEFNLGDRLYVSIPSSHDKLRGLEAETLVQRVEVWGNGRISLGLETIAMQ